MENNNNKSVITKVNDKTLYNKDKVLTKNLGRTNRLNNENPTHRKPNKEKQKKDNKNNENTEERLVWVNIVRSYLPSVVYKSDEFINKTYIHKNFTSINTEKLKTKLLDHQRKTVKAMIDLENKRYLRVTTNDIYNTCVIETCAGFLSEKPGSGKTYEIFAVIAENTKLPTVAEITTIPFVTKPEKVLNRVFVDMGYTTEVRKYYQKVFRQTLIFVGKSVMSQWELKIKTYTHFKAFIIENVFDLRKFYKMIFKNNEITDAKINKYDIILIKNGKITGEFKVPELENTTIKNNRSRLILNVFGELFKNVCFNRVVMDDCDTLDIPGNAKIIPSMFTWFVSATKKKQFFSTKVTDKMHTVEDYINFRNTYAQIFSNEELFTFFNVGCDNDFIDESVKVSVTKYYVYKFDNPNDTFISMIGSMGTDSNLTIAEMLNGDAILTAADTVGVKTNKVSDIFEKILDKSWETYKKNLEIEKYIPIVKKLLQKLSPYEDDDTISKTNLDLLKKNIKKPGPLKWVNDTVKHSDIKITDVINEVETENNKEKVENGKVIARVKDNLKQGECPITCEPLSKCEGVVVLKCCGVAISKEASVSIFTGFGKKCPMCRNTVNKDDVILIDRNFDFSKIINEEIFDEEEYNKNVGNIKLPTKLDNNETPEIKEGKQEINDLQEDEKLKNNEFVADLEDFNEEELNKYNCVIKIIEGKDNELNDVREIKNEILIPGLLQGSCDLGDAPENERKVIIYCSFPETMKNVETRLAKKNFKFVKLQGTSKQINEIHRRYNLPNEDVDAINILLITTPKYSAGLDLQNTTDTIFLHYVIDINVTTQIGGRSSRYGRKRNNRFHYILYRNEHRYMFNNTIFYNL